MSQSPQPPENGSPQQMTVQSPQGEVGTQFVNSAYVDNQMAKEIRNRETQRRAMEAAVTRSEIQQTVVAVEQIDMENQEQLLVYYEQRIIDLEQKMAAATTPVTQALYQRQLEILTAKVDSALSGQAPEDFGKLPQDRKSFIPQPVTTPPQTILVQSDDVRRITGPQGHPLTGLLLSVRDGKHYRPLSPQEKQSIETAINR